MAERWYPWSAGLDPDEFAKALIGVSLAPDATTQDAAVDAIFRELSTKLPPLLRHIPQPNQEWVHPLEPRLLAQAWDTASGRYQPANQREDCARKTAALPLRTVLDLGNQDWLDDVRESLRRVFTTTLLEGPSDHPVQWSWPARIGVLTVDGSLKVFSGLDLDPWNGKLYKLLRARGSRDPFDLLVVDGPETLALGASCTATAVIQLGNWQDSLQDRGIALQHLREQSRAPVAMHQSRPDDVAGWVHDLIEELSHRNPLCIALSTIACRNGVGEPLILADRTKVGRMDLTESVAGYMRRLDRVLQTGAVIQFLMHLGPALGTRLGVGPSTPPLDLKQLVLGGLDTLSYDYESRGASDLSRIDEALDRAEDWAEWGPPKMGAVPPPTAGPPPAAAPPSDPATRGGGHRSPEPASDPTPAPAERLRFLRARLLHGQDELPDGPLQSDTEYTVQSSIGPPAADWLDAGQAFHNPDAPPDDPERGWQLRVIAWEPALMAQPQAKDLWLPRRGETLPVSFSMRTTADHTSIGARITVLHENRVLQTGLLIKDSEGPVKWSIDAAPEMHLGRIDRDRKFAASLLVNDDANGVPRLTMVADDDLSLVNLADSNLSDFTNAIQRILDDIADTPHEFETLESPGTVKLLTSLARRGAGLYQTLAVDLQLKESIQAADRVQIVSARPTSFFPAEFLYAARAPKTTAVLCPGAKAALAPDAGECTGPHDREHVCPTLFWSVAKSVERHAFQPGEEIPAPFVFTATEGSVSSSRNPLRHVMFAASTRVDGFDANATTDLKTKINDVSKGFTAIKDETEWETAVVQDRPSIFVFLPHHFRSEGDEKFEMGSSLTIAPPDLGPEHVCGPEGPQPIVILMGCKTADARIVFDSIVQVFRRNGAAVVISTYATILGRHAAPTTSRLLEMLDERLGAGQPVRVGDLLRDLRRELLSKGVAMVLGLTAYGDADVVLNRVRDE